MATFKILVKHEVDFPTNGAYTGLIMSWLEKAGIGYTFSRGSYVSKLTDDEWVEFITFLSGDDFKGEEDVSLH